MEPRLIGYARVSTLDQDLNLQLDALINAGCLPDHIFTDKVSGAKSDRPGLNECIKTLRDGDTLIVWRLDRLGRSIHHLIEVVENLKKRGIAFKSICDGGIDTTTASGELVFNIFCALAHFERQLIKERTKAGLDAARARGRVGGRKPLDPESSKVQMAKKMSQNKEISVTEICNTLGISRATYYRYLTAVARTHEPILFTI